MAETLRDLSDRLSALLTDLDIAVRVRLRDSEKQAVRQVEETTRGETSLWRVLGAAVRWLTHPAADPLTSRRVRSAHERRSGR